MTPNWLCISHLSDNKEEAGTGLKQDMGLLLNLEGISFVGSFVRDIQRRSSSTTGICLLSCSPTDPKEVTFERESQTLLWSWCDLVSKEVWGQRDRVQ